MKRALRPRSSRTGGRLARLGMLVAAALVPSSAAAQNRSNGPLTFEEGSPLHRVSYTAMMEEASTVPRGRLGIDLALGISNIFEQDSSATHVLFIDMERVVSNVTLRWGVNDRLEVGGRLTLETTGGGVLDGVILGWHERLGLGQANRDRFPEGAYAQHLSNGSGTAFLDVPSSALSFEDARLFLKWVATESRLGDRVLAVKGEVRMPGGSNPVGPERADGAVTALGRFGLGHWHVHGMIGASTVRASPELDPILRSASTFLVLALERSFGSISAVAQYHAQSPVLTSFDHREIDRSPTNLVLGFSGSFGDGWRWDASFQEDLPADTPAIDFTLGLRLSKRW